MNEGNLNPGQHPLVAPPAPTAAAAYEFSDTENMTLDRTSKWAKALAMMFFVQVALQVINLNILAIVVDLAIAISFWKGASLLDQVVRTRDNDVPHMIGALEQLRNAFTIRLIVTGIAAVIGLILSVGFFVQYEFLYDPADVEPPAAAVVEADEDAEEENATEAEEEPAEEEDAPVVDEAPAAEAGAPAEGDAAPAAEAGEPADPAAAPSEPAAGDTPPA